jgi:hypothetical protein
MPYGSPCKRKLYPMHKQNTRFMWLWQLGLGLIGLGLIVLAIWPNLLSQVFGAGVLGKTQQRTTLLRVQVLLALGGIASFTLAAYGRLLAAWTRTGFRAFYYLIVSQCQTFRKTWIQLPIWQRLGFVTASLITLAPSIFLALNLPITPDEANVYSSLVEHGPLVALLYYPLPSNHILHTFLASVVDVVSPSPLLSMRLPAVFAFTVLILLVSAYTLDRLGFWPSVTATLSLAASPGLVLYGALGRGYVFVALAVAILLPLTVRLIQGKQETDARRIAFALAGILGLVAVPTMLYPFLALCLLWVATSKERSLAIQTIFAALLVSSLVYLPSTILSGWPWRFYNAPDAPFWPIQAALGHVAFVGEFVSPLPSAWVNWLWPAPIYVQPLCLLLPVLLVLLLASKPSVPVSRLVLALLLFSFGLFPLIQGYFPPEKAYTWLGVCYAFVLAEASARMGKWAWLPVPFLLFSIWGQVPYLLQRLHAHVPEMW